MSGLSISIELTAKQITLPGNEEIYTIGYLINERLCEDVESYILKFLDSRDLTELAPVSKNFYQMILKYHPNFKIMAIAEAINSLCKNERPFTKSKKTTCLRCRAETLLNVMYEEQKGAKGIEGPKLVEECQKVIRSSQIKHKKFGFFSFSGCSHFPAPNIRWLSGDVWEVVNHDVLGQRLRF